MTAQVVFLAILTAATFGGWPLVANKSGLSAPWIAAFVLLGSLVPSFLLGIFNGDYSAPPARSGVWIALVAGLLNGLGFLIYSRQVSADSATPPAQFVATVAVLVTVFIPIFAWALQNEIPSLKQFLGYGCAALAVYLLK